MNYALLWVSVLAASLLWVAMLAACFGRIRRKWVRRVLYFVSALVPLAILGGFAVSAVYLKFTLHLEVNWFDYSVLIVLAYGVGAVVVLYRAGRGEPGWPRGSLLLAWAIAMGVGYMTVANLDLAIRARCALLAVKSNALYLATLPPVVSEKQNAAPLYEQAFARLKEFPPEGIDNPPFGANEEFDPKEPATVAFLDHHAQTLTLLRQAAARPVCRFEEDLKDQDFARVVPELSPMRSAANLLNLHARAALAKGRPAEALAEALADTQAILQMSRHIGQRPLLVYALTGMGIDALGMQTLQMALPAVQGASDLETLKLEELPSFGQTLRQALRGEECYGLMNYPQQPEIPPSIAGSTLLAPTTGLGGAFFRILFLDVDAYVALMEQTQDWATRPYFQIRDQLPRYYESPQRRGMMPAILAGSLRRTFDTLARIEAQDESGRIFVAATRFRLDHGQLPAQLNELVPKYLDTIPLDPFDGQPLRLTIKEGQWTLYSVGPDGVDNGGEKMNSKEKGDLPYTLKPAGPESATRP